MAKEKPDLSAVEVITPPVRLSFPALFEPKPRARGAEKLTFQATILIPPTVKLQPFVDAAKAAMIAKFGKVIPMQPGKNPIHKCEEKEYAGYEPGWHYIALNSDRPPGVVDQRGVPITDPNKVYAGCWVNVYMNAYGWSHPTGGRGVSFGLNAVQFVKDDERLDGRKSAKDVFEALELEDGEVPAGSVENLDDLFGG